MKAIKISLIIYTVLSYIPYIFIYIPTIFEKEAMELESETDIFSIILLISIGLLLLSWIISLIIVIIQRKKSMDWNPFNALLFISIIKSVMIPVYILNFISGVICLLMGFFFGFSWILIPFFFIGSLLNLVITSLVSTISFNVSKKKGMIDNPEGIGLCVSQWFFIVDIVFCWLGTFVVKAGEPIKVESNENK